MKSLKFSCSDDLREWLESEAAEDGRTLSSMIRVILYQAKREAETIALEETTA